MNKKKNRLSDYVWGFGIEHEMHVFHKPKLNNDIKDFILFDSDNSRKRLLENIKNKKIKLSVDDINFLMKVPYEPTGRLCNGQWVIKKVPYNMPEFITDVPKCSILTDRNINNLTREIVIQKEKYLNLLKKDPITKKQIEKYGELCCYPTGMTSFLKYPENCDSLNYKFKKDKNNNDIVRDEYLGSYHITLTLPYKQDIKLKKFIDNHVNFSNQLQWIEPLLISQFFSCDQKAVGSKYDRVRGSFRVMMIGWGNLAGSDVTKFKDGIGRYSNIESYWRNGLNFKDIEKLKPCYKPSPAAIKEKGLSSLSSDFRTFGSNDPERPDHRESGLGMTIGNGVEFRIFDNFDDNLLIELIKFIILVAENSRNYKTKNFVYKNKAWINATQSVMKNGWNARLTLNYISELRKNLNLKIKTKSLVACDVIKVINKELYEKNKNGDWVKIMIGNLTKNSSDILPSLSYNVNYYSWVLSFAVKLNRNKTIYNNFYEFLNYLIEYKRKYNKKISYNDYKNIFFMFFDKKNWINDCENIAYFLKTELNFDIIKLENGSINYLIIKDINIYKNLSLDKIILNIFDNNYIKSNTKDVLNLL